ncbi:MAG: hypothetical protein ACOY3X_13670, partial [Pseudomonadota bacterium]
MRAGSTMAGRTSRQHQQGLMYLWMLFLVFLLGLGIGKSLEVYSAMIEREKAADAAYEKALYEKAVKDYYENSPGYMKQYPAKMENLLLDPRYLTV